MVCIVLVLYIFNWCRLEGCYSGFLWEMAEIEEGCGRVALGVGK